MTNDISFQIDLTVNYETAIEKVTAALKEEGFGILTEIDVKTTLKKKIDQDFRPYVILGACNPPLAHKALESDPLAGLMLPCNVTVEATDSGSRVNLVNPRVMLLSFPMFAQSQALKDVAEDAHARIERVAKALAK